MHRAAFIVNKYYTDVGMQHAYDRLNAELSKRGVELLYCDDIYAKYPMDALNYDFALFWDKDVKLAHRLEDGGLRLFNSARTVEICDDKEKTFAAAYGKANLPRTLVAPLVYDISDGADARFIDLIEREINYPIVVKECSGSQGRQVYLARSKRELESLRAKLMHVSHLYQEFVLGEGAGTDIRVYVVGGKAIGAVKRVNTTDFRSNVSMGGDMTRIELNGELSESAEKIAGALGLEFGSVDFIPSEREYFFIESNSSAYAYNPERLGIPLLKDFAGYVCEVVYGAK